MIQFHSAIGIRHIKYVRVRLLSFHITLPKNILLIGLCSGMRLVQDRCVEARHARIAYLWNNVKFVR